jgi:hypothetical protein
MTFTSSTYAVAVLGLFDVEVQNLNVKLDLFAATEDKSNVLVVQLLLPCLQIDPI